jgi:hypothetical protein
LRSFAVIGVYLRFVFIAGAPQPLREDAANLLLERHSALAC